MLNDINREQYSTISGGIGVMVVVGVIAPILSCVGYYIAEKMRTDIKRNQDKVCNSDSMPNATIFPVKIG